MKKRKANLNNPQKAVFGVACVMTLLFIFSLVLFPAPNLADETLSANTINSPDRLLTESLNAHQTKLIWVDRSENEQGFKIERATDRAFMQNQVYFDANSNETNYIDENTEPLTIYYYRVKAYAAESESVWSNIAITLTPDTIPVSPTNLFVSSPGSFQVQLSWNDNSNNESGFRIDRATNATFTEGLIGFTVDASKTKCLDYTTPGGTYYYRVVAFNQGGESAPSNSGSISVNDQLFEDSFLIGPVTANVTMNGFAQYSIPFVVNSSGIVQNSVTLTLSDQNGKVTVPKDTKMLNFNGHAQTTFGYNSPDIVPQPPADRMVLKAFSFGPSKTTFDPPITMTMKYDPTAVSKGISLNDIKIGSWDGSDWELFSATSANTNTGEVTFSVSHFSLFAIMATKSQIPSPYSVHDPIVFPRNVSGVESIMVQVTAQNSGSASGNYELVVKFNDVIEESRVVALESGASYTETFEIFNKGPQYYNIDINGLKTSFEIEPQPSSTTTPGATASETSITTNTTMAPSSTKIEIPESSYVPARPNMTLIVGIAGGMGLIILGSILYFFIRK